MHDFDDDRWRDATAVAHGCQVLRFTYLHLTRRVREVAELIEATGDCRATTYRSGTSLHESGGYERGVA